MTNRTVDPVQSMLLGDIEVKLDRLLFAGLPGQSGLTQDPSRGLASHAIIRHLAQPAVELFGFSCQNRHAVHSVWGSVAKMVRPLDGGVKRVIFVKYCF